MAIAARVEKSLPVLFALFALFALVGCGGSGGPSPVDPAAVDAGRDSGANARSPDAAAMDGGASHPVAACAAPLDGTTSTLFYDAARCLFEGADAPQRGVTVGAIDKQRAAIARGRVLDTVGTPMAAVRVTVSGHAEYGETTTRADGAYDLPVNGGGALTLRYEAAGRLAAQRHRSVGWATFAVYPDVVLLVEQPSTAVDLTNGAGPVVVEQPISRDASGERHQVLLFAPGTRAKLTHPDGTTQVLSAFHVRVTEYTVGESGPSAMPGDLPPVSGYTYANELTVDEARAAGVTDVQFDPPAVSYVEDFLHFPAGTTVPSGYYDAAHDVWKAGDNGLVVRILAVNDGVAVIDGDGDGRADDVAALMRLGIGADELGVLGKRYQAGQLVWRVALPHFSAWDCNWAFGPPADAVRPRSGAASAAWYDCKTTASGSIIGCEDQSLGEVVPIVGTPYALRYQSERMPGRRDANRIEIQLSGPELPASVKRIELEVHVLGRVYRETFAAKPSLQTTYAWDGKDAYGRTWQGAQPATVRVGYVYQGAYQVTERFGYGGSGTISGDATRQEVTLWNEHRTRVGTLDASPLGFGGWTLDALNVYDPHGKALHTGTGQRRSAEKIGGVAEPFAGSTAFSTTSAGDGGPAREAVLLNATFLVSAPDGSVFVSESGAAKVRKIAPDGTITTYAGTGTAGFSGDGGPAVAAQLDYPNGLALAKDGTLYVADYGNSRIRAVSPNGVISTYGGGGSSFAKQMPATTAFFGFPSLLALASDGTLFFTDTALVGLHSIGPDGVFATRDVRLPGVVQGMAITAADELLFALVSPVNGGAVVKLDTSGVLSTVVGDGALQGEWLPASSAAVEGPHALAIADDGSVLFRDGSQEKVRRITPDGFVETIAGGGKPGVDQQQTLPAVAANFGAGRGIVVAPDRNILVSEGGFIRRIRPPLPGFTGAEISVAAPDGGTIDTFDERGRHLRSSDALSGATLLSFSYDEAGRLASVADVDGNTTTFARDAQGNPTAVVSPYGQTTRLTLGSDGYLASVTNPNGETTTFAYASGGMLTSKIDPRDPTDVHRFAYDELGRLISDTDPSQFVQMLERSAAGAGQAVTLRSPMGRTRSVAFEAAGPATLKTIETATDGLTTTTERDAVSTRYVTPTATISVALSADPRFGMQASLPLLVVEPVGGSPVTIASTRAIELRDRASVLAVKTATEITSINGNAFTTSWDAASRTSTATTPRGRVSSRTFDSRNHLLTAKDGDLLPVAFTYDNHGRVIAVTQDARSAGFAYGADGWLAAVTDPMGQTTKLTHDGAGRIVAAILPDGSALALTYDRNGNLTSLTPPGRSAHALRYLPGDLLVSYEPPPFTAGTPASTTYAYDRDRMMTELTRPDQLKAVNSYDSAGRVSALTMPTGATMFAYSPSTGQLTSVSGPYGETVTLAYRGSLLTDVSYRGAVPGAVHVTYDALLHVASEAVNAEPPIAWSYDSDGLLTQVGPLAIAHSATTALISGTGIGSALDSYAYNGYGELSAYTAASLYKETLARDALGRITQKSEVVQGVTKTYAYAYDARGRLIDVTVDGASAAHVTYDPNGDRTAFSTPAGALAATYDAQDRLLTHGSTSYSYGANGELATKTEGGQTTSYTFDALGELLRVALPDGRTVEYLYDGLQRRIAKKLNGAVVQGFLYGTQQGPIAELDGAGNLVSRFVYGTRSWSPDLIIQGATTYRVVADHLGSPRLVIDSASNAVAQRIDHGAWGAVVANSAPTLQPFGFGGGLYDADTQLVHFGSRDYDPAVGRFISKDPAGLGGGANLYTYAANDPVNHLDSDGHVAILVPILTGAAVGGLEGAAFGIASSLLANGCIDWRAVGGDALSGAVGGAVGGGLGVAVKAWGGAARGGAAAMKLDRFKMTQTVANHAADIVKKGAFKGELARPYLNSPHTVEQILQAGKGVADPGGVAGALRWDVAGTFRGSQGTWELVMKGDTILHFNFITP